MSKPKCTRVFKDDAQNYGSTTLVRFSKIWNR